jgi:hypothetical protein
MAAACSGDARVADLHRFPVASGQVRASDLPLPSFHLVSSVFAIFVFFCGYISGDEQGQFYRKNASGSPPSTAIT